MYESGHLKENLLAYIRSLDPAIFGVTKISSITMEPLSTGFHNINFLLRLNDTDEKRFVLRLHPDNQPGHDKTAAEAANMRSLPKDLPAPNVLFCARPDFVNSSVLIMEFVEGELRELSDVSEAQLQNLAQVLAAMHGAKRDHFSSLVGGPADSSGTFADYQHAVTAYNTERYLGALPASAYQDVAGLIERAQHQIDELLEAHQALFTRNDFSLLHTDIGAGNIVWRGDDPVLIDWEEVTFGDPADEVAYVFMNNGLDDARREMFLRTYLATNPDPTLVERLPVYTATNRLVDFLWSLHHLYRHASGQIAEESQKSADIYQQNYHARQQALEDMLSQQSD